MNRQEIKNILWDLAPLCSRKEIEEATNKIINSHEQEGLSQTTADKILAELWEATKHPDVGKHCRNLVQIKMGRFINSFVVEDKCSCGMIDRLTNDDFVCLNCGETTHYAPIPEGEIEIAKRVIEEYIENGLKEKYRKGAGHGWEKGISYKHEVSLLQDCYDWLDQQS